MTINGVDDNSENSNIVHKNNFKLMGNGIINTSNGNKQLPINKSAIYKIVDSLVDNRKFVINIKMDIHPTGYHSNMDKYMTWISFIVDNEKLAINLSDLKTYDSNLIETDNMKFNNITVDPIAPNSEHIKNLIPVMINDSGAFYRLITIYGNLKFYCIRFYGIKSVPTMVYLDGNTGIYYNKNTLIILNDLFD